MGIAASKNKSATEVFAEAVTENLNSSMVQIAQQSTSTISPTQIIRIKASAGRDLNVSDVQQKIVANVDVQKFLSNMTETQMKAMMKNAVETTAKDNQSVDHALVIGGSLSSNESTAAVRTRNVNRLVNSYSYSQFVSDVQNILPSQTIEVGGTAGRDVNIADISQYILVELVSKQMSENMTKTFNEIATEVSTTTTKIADQKSSAGFSMGWISITVIIIVIVIAAGAAAWYFYGGGREMVEEQLSKSGMGPSAFPQDTFGNGPDPRETGAM